MKLTKAKLEAATLADQVTRHKDGTFTVRRGFFYRHGEDAQSYRDKVEAKLTEAGLSFEVTDQGEHWAAFRGGATVASQSHFWVKVREAVAA